MNQWYPAADWLEKPVCNLHRC